MPGRQEFQGTQELLEQTLCQRCIKPRLQLKGQNLAFTLKPEPVGQRPLPAYLVVCWPLLLPLPGWEQNIGIMLGQWARNASSPFLSIPLFLVQGARRGAAGEVSGWAEVDTPWQICCLR